MARDTFHRQPFLPEYYLTTCLTFKLGSVLPIRGERLFWADLEVDLRELAYLVSKYHNKAELM